MTDRCTQVTNNLAAYSDGELSPKEARAVRAHVQECPVCRESLFRLQEVEREMRLLPDVSPSAGFERTFQMRLQAERARVQSAPRGLWAALERFRDWFGPREVVAAAAGLALLVVTIGVFTLGRTPGLPQEKLHLASDMDLFLNMEVIENSDALEHFEIITMLDVLAEESRG